MIAEATKLLRSVATTWFVAACLPIPALVMLNPATNADVSCLYLGLASAWLATQILGFGDYPDSRPAWLAKTFAIWLALATNAALFIAIGQLLSVRSNLPFPLLALFAVIPSVGLVPWMTLRLGEPFKALVLSALVLLACKLAACVVARMVYGPDYIEHGYVAGDWRTAKLMISLTWSSITAISFGLAVLCYWQFERRAELKHGRG
jgi:hypothetical protein